MPTHAPIKTTPSPTNVPLPVNIREHVFCDSDIRGNISFGRSDNNWESHYYQFENPYPNQQITIISPEGYNRVLMWLKDDHFITITFARDMERPSGWPLIYGPLPAGTYVIQASTQYNNGRYRMIIKCNPSEPTSSPTMSPLPVQIQRQIQCGSDVYGETSIHDNHHYYLFDNKYENYSAVISLCDGSNFDTVVYLRDMELNRLQFNDDFCEYKSQITTDSLAIGEYLIEINGHNGGVGNYHLQIDCALPEFFVVNTELEWLEAEEIVRIIMVRLWQVFIMNMKMKKRDVFVTPNAGGT